MCQSILARARAEERDAAAHNIPPAGGFRKVTGRAAPAISMTNCARYGGSSSSPMAAKYSGIIFNGGPAAPLFLVVFLVSFLLPRPSERASGLPVCTISAGGKNSRDICNDFVVVFFFCVAGDVNAE